MKTIGRPGRRPDQARRGPYTTMRGTLLAALHRAVLLAALGAVSAGTPSSARGQTADRVSALGWLSGCWEHRTASGLTVELWSAPLGGLMLGGSVSLRDGVARGYEHLLIRSEDGVLVYVATPSGQRETRFTETALSDSSVAFENLAHDFPTRITYRRRGADSVIARAEGPAPGGVRGFDLPMARVACGGR